MTRSEISAFFPWPMPPPYFGGMNYAVPTLAWLQGPFWEFFKARYWSTNSDKWKFRWECRDFARAYACAAQECWGETSMALAPDSDALAVGEIWFTPNPLNIHADHAICPVFTENGLQFIEPQTGQLYPMTADQIASRHFLRF